MRKILKNILELKKKTEDEFNKFLLKDENKIYVEYIQIKESTTLLLSVITEKYLSDLSDIDCSNINISLEETLNILETLNKNIEGHTI
ncbi:hypothetical protein [Aliarcobacter butzleri]|uniref:hypothetical protein n=1 Tax=Aliarcobacter butzleri TaxID=28197 RepID=UPI002B254286|nr:hypothetical protein [Aliarcobacter butzleri]